MSKNRTIINEWENLTALSNRRLNVQSLNTPLKIQWSIDRITIVGQLKENFDHENSFFLVTVRKSHSLAT